MTADKLNPPKPKSRWFQFSLRTLLIFMTVCAIPFGWIGMKFQNHQQKSNACIAISNAGGQLRFDFEVESEKQSNAQWEEASASAAKSEKACVIVAVPIVYAPPKGPAWLRQWLGEYFFSEVVEASWPQAKDDDLKWLEDLPYLETASLNSDNVTDAGLYHLIGMTRLRNLDLKETKVTSDGIRKLQDALPNCKIVRE